MNTLKQSGSGQNSGQATWKTEHTGGKPKEEQKKNPRTPSNMDPSKYVVANIINN